MNLNEKIIRLRKLNNLSQEQLAEKIGITRQAITKWENNESIPDIDNLIKLSNIFNVTLDQLLKDNSCKELEEKNINIDKEKIIDFLIEAKNNTYAGDGEKLSPSLRPNSKDLIYEKDKYKYIDTYLGGKRFIGEEALFENNEPIWGMNYYGEEFSDNCPIEFLKEALKKVPKDMPYRGPRIYKEGINTYICEVNGTFEKFKGKEKIYNNNELVFECIFSGGIIK